MPAILAVVSDLMFQSRLREQALALGYDFAAADTPAAVRNALAFRRQVEKADNSAALRKTLKSKPALVVVDLHVAGVDWRDAVMLAKERGVPVLAFGRHTEAQLLRSARDRGCDRVVPRSQLVEELAALIAELAASPS